MHTAPGPTRPPRPARTRPDDTTTTSVRVFPELRAVHLERLPLMTDAVNLYFSEKYDLLGADLPHELRRTTLAAAVRYLFAAPQVVLELPEPLWMRFLPRWVALAAAWRLGGLLRRRPRRVVVYAMELTPVPNLLTGRRGAPPWLAGPCAAAIGCLIRLVVDRICFASPASASLYTSLPGVASIDHRTVLELPTATLHPAPATQYSVTYLGELSERGGIRQLMLAWERVEATIPSARLTFVGGGPLLDVVEQWAAEHPSSRAATGALPRARALDVVARTTVLVAPSVPHGRWREQIGLPIKEGLAAGATVVTTRQTGLSDWLAADGHHVLPVGDDLVPRLADALARAVEHPLDRARVRASLPEVDRRIQSDAWLHARPGERTS